MPSAGRRGSNKWCTVCGRVADLDFDDISRVVPWIETAADLGLDLDGSQRGEPRAFKSHLPYNQVPAGARYIVSLRGPRDALVSAYRFFEGWFFEPGSIDIETLGRLRFVAGRTTRTSFRGGRIVKTRTSCCSHTNT